MLLFRYYKIERFIKEYNKCVTGWFLMKLFICSDVHDDVEALTAFADYAMAQQADRILIAGDLSLRPYKAKDLETLAQSRNVKTFIDAKNSHNTEVLKAMKEVLDRTRIPYNVVPGNYDGRLQDVFIESEIHAKTARVGQAKLFGYGGADAWPQHILLLVQMGQIVNFNHNELYALLSRENPDITLIHNPPLGLCDDMFDGNNVGTPASRKYIAEKSPKLMISGHIHEAGPNANNPHNVAGVAVVENPKTNRKTVVVNPGNLGRWEIIDFPSLQTVRSFDYGTFIRVDVEEDGTPLKVEQYSVQENGRRIGKVKSIGEYTF